MPPIRRKKNHFGPISNSINYLLTKKVKRITAHLNKKVIANAITKKVDNDLGDMLVNMSINSENEDSDADMNDDTFSYSPPMVTIPLPSSSTPQYVTVLDRKA